MIRNALVFLATAVLAMAADPGPQAFLKQHCVSCHGAEKTKGDIRLDQTSALTHEIWERVYEQLSAGEMPPRKKARPNPEATAEVMQWISARLNQAGRKISDTRGAAIRRLNRAEYANTIRDLFEIDFTVGEGIPQDDSAHGFDNVDDALTLSPLLLEKYLGEAERVTRRVLLSDQPETIKKRWVGTNLVYHKSKHIRHGPAVEFQMVGRNNGGGAFFPTPIPFKRDGYITSAPGKYRVRVKAHPTGPKVGPSARWRIVYKPTDFETNPPGCEDPRLVFVLNGEFAGRVHLTNREPTVYEFTTTAEQGQKFGWNFENGVGGVRAGWYEKYIGPAVIVHWMEIEGPLVSSWPTRARSSVFFRGVADESRSHAREILQRFAERAYRRPLAEAEVNELLHVFDADQAAGGEFKSSIAVAVQRVLCSPEFLFLNRRQGMDAHKLASRISYFLWSSMPDEELFAAAADGRLARDPEAQVRRMLRDRKSSEFVENFAGQWLQLRKLQDIAVDRALYPDFNDYLRTLFARETKAFFREILDHDLSILNFIDSDFAMLNDLLAHHYGIAGVEGPEFRRVNLDKTWHRGGLTGHASILTLTTCGTRTSPILRGVWVMESLLGLEAPPPPKEVPELPPTPRGRVSQRNRLEAHRDLEACARCHDQIDPLGFPLEHYDVIGRWRTDYGISTRYSRGRRQYGPPVDGAAEFTSGDSVAGADDFRVWLRKDRQELFVRGFVRKMLTYALGRGLTLADRPVVDELVESLKRNEYRMSDLIVAIVKSRPFNLP